MMTESGGMGRVVVYGREGVLTVEVDDVQKVEIGR